MPREAKLLVVLLDDMEAVLRTVDVARRNFPQLKILARARNRRHAHLLMDRGVDGLVRETFYSSLVLAEQALTELGIEPAAAARAVALFRDHDEKALVDSHAFYRDEQKLIQTTQDAAAELESLFEADRERGRSPGPTAQESEAGRRRRAGRWTWFGITGWT